MALSATTQWEVRNGGSDTVCGGAFDPGQTAGMLTDLQCANATSFAPVVYSASYDFTANDVGAFVFVASGTGWKPGWYKILSIDAGASPVTATLEASLGDYRAYGGDYITGVNTANGCGTTDDLTTNTGTWSIDYSQQDAAQIAYTDLACAGAGLTVSSATSPFGKQQVGNSIVVTGGDANITAGIYVIASVSGVTATVIGAANISTGAVTTGTGNLGGGFASIGRAGQYIVGQNDVWVKYNATAFTSTSTSNNVAGGRITLPAGGTGDYTTIHGYDAVRGDETANRPTLTWDAIAAGSSYLVTGGTRTGVYNLIIDGNRSGGTTNPGGFTQSGGQGHLHRTKIKSCTTTVGVASTIVTSCEFTDNTALITGGAQTWVDCYFHDNTVGAITVPSGQPTFDSCIFDSNAGAGIVIAGSVTGMAIRNCTFYGQASTPGISITSAPLSLVIQNCVFEGNGTYGITFTGGPFGGVLLLNNAFYNNTSGPYSSGLRSMQVIGSIHLTASPFADAANGDFRLTSTGAGAQIAGGGYAQTFPGLSWNNYPPIGATDPQSSSGGGGGGYFLPW